jgi:hypothetical protein
MSEVKNVAKDESIRHYNVKKVILIVQLEDGQMKDYSWTDVEYCNVTIKIQDKLQQIKDKATRGLSSAKQALLNLI